MKRVAVTAVLFAALVGPLFMVAGCATSPPRLAAGDAAFADLAWLAGGWGGADARGVRTEEVWTPASSGAMLAVNRTMVGGRTVFFEYLRIERTEDGGLVYLASPRGRHPPTPFPMISATSDGVVFENLDHDYPQRITYRREPDGSLLQRISGVENGREKAGEWRMIRHRLE